MAEQTFISRHNGKEVEIKIKMDENGRKLRKYKNEWKEICQKPYCFRKHSSDTKCWIARKQALSPVTISISLLVIPFCFLC